MSIAAWLVETRNRKMVSYLSYAAAGVVLLFTLIWSVQIGIANADATWMRINLKKQEQDLANNRQNAPVIPVDKTGYEVPHGYAAVEQFRALSVRLASTDKVTLEQFSAGNALVPFASHYGAKADDANYKQIHVSMTLMGNLPAVMQMMRQLADSKFPFEFASLDLAPQITDGNDEIKVSTRVELELLTLDQPAKESSS